MQKDWAPVENPKTRLTVSPDDAVTCWLRSTGAHNAPASAPGSALSHSLQPLPELPDIIAPLADARRVQLASAPLRQQPLHLRDQGNPASMVPRHGHSDEVPVVVEDPRGVGDGDAPHGSAVQALEKRDDSLEGRIDLVPDLAVDVIAHVPLAARSRQRVRGAHE